MALIRGEKGLHPCPICLVPHDQQSNLSTSYALRTEAHTREIYEAGQTLTSAEREELFKSEGLRNVSVRKKHMMSHLTLTKFTLYRMLFGLYSSQIPMLHYLGIICTTMHMVWVVNIYGQKFSVTLMSWVDKH
jgi:hypothetical protein